MSNFFGSRRLSKSASRLEKNQEKDQPYFPFGKKKKKKTSVRPGNYALLIVGPSDWGGKARGPRDLQLLLEFCPP